MTTDRVVVCDVDGVLADFTWGFSGLLESRNRGNGTQAQWDFPSSREEIARAWKRVDASTTFWQNLPPLISEPDVYDLNQLARRVTVVYMTGREDRDNDTQGQTERWLRMMGLPAGTVILSKDKAASVKAGLAGAGGEFVEVVGFIDDHAGNVNKMADVLRSGKVFIRDWPYNREHVNRHVERVSSLGEFAHRVGESL